MPKTRHRLKRGLRLLAYGRLHAAMASSVDVDGDVDPNSLLGVYRDPELPAQRLDAVLAMLASARLEPEHWQWKFE
ncbi:MAG: hypothetical protein GY711_34620 [bacterium]|nr:hypothetical protein [bacterium]